MTHRPTASPDLQTGSWSADEGDDLIEFAEFTIDDSSGHDSPAGSSSVAEESENSTEQLSAPPAWFRRKPGQPARAGRGDGKEIATPHATSAGDERTRSAVRRRTKKRSGDNSSLKQSAAPAVIASEDEPEALDWRKDWKKIIIAWLISNASCGYGISFIVHTVLLLALSAIVYHSMDDNQSISMIITDADAMPVEFTEIMDLTVEPAGASENQLPQLTKIPITAEEAEISSSLLDSTASMAGNNGEGGDTDEGFGFMFSMPEGGKVVSKGSFSAWTVPEDPEPRKDYMIVIRIRLPEKTRLYRISDLSGKVEGSDFYVQHLPFDPNRKDLGARSERGGQIIRLRASDRLRVIDNHVQVMIPVMGGDTLVRDTIHVRSRLLKEDQTLEIEF